MMPEGATLPTWRLIAEHLNIGKVAVFAVVEQHL
jgi:hypothetical protein